MAAEGYSTGEALKAIKETAAEILSANYSYELGGLSREEEKTTGSSAIIFAICLVLIYLILCALYESIFVPLAIILSVPCGLLGCFIFAQAIGTLALLFLVPPLFMVFQNIQEKVFSEKSAYNSTEEAVQTEPDKLKKGYDL